MRLKCEPNPGSVVTCSTAKDGPCAVSQCSASSGKCIQAAKDQGKACNDGLACTSSDVCADGACAGAASVCDDKDPCITDTCDPVTGACGFKPATCDDGDACTSDSCAPKTGCIYPAATGPACNDADPCTDTDTCAAGVCKGKALDCDDGNVCTSETCNASQGCLAAAKDGGACDDGNGCTTGDKCGSTVCLAGTPATCNDGVGCTVDGCDVKTGNCTHVVDADQCDDGDACTADGCDLTAKTCSHGVAAEGTVCGNGLGCWKGQCAWAKQIAAGGQHVCAVRTTGTVMCWGMGDRGQLGDNTTGLMPDGKTPMHASTPVQAYNFSDVISVSASPYTTCALRKDGTLWCWGDNGSTTFPYGLLGIGTNASFVPIPTQVAGLDQVIAHASSDRHRCAVRKDGALWCWGSGSNGQLGGGAVTGSPVEKATASLVTGAVSVGTGLDPTCAVLANGTVKCFGRNNLGQVGEGDMNPFNVVAPSEVVGGAGIVQVSGGENHNCGRTVGGQVLCWGSNTSGQVGNDKVGAGGTTLPSATA